MKNSHFEYSPGGGIVEGSSSSKENKESNYLFSSSKPLPLLIGRMNNNQYDSRTPEKTSVGNVTARSQTVAIGPNLLTTERCEERLSKNEYLRAYQMREEPSRNGGSFTPVGPPKLHTAERAKSRNSYR